MVQPKGKSTKTLQRAGEEGVSPGGFGGEGTLILSYICRLGPFLGVQILKFNILGAGFRKMNIFVCVCGMRGRGGHDETEDICFLFFFGGGGAIAKLDYFWELFLNILWLYLKIKIQNWNNFWGC